MPDNPRYKKGAIWLTRTNIKAFFDKEYSNKDVFITIPQGEYIMLLTYYMSGGYSEHVIILWNDHTYIVYDIDTAYQFNINPGGHNTKKERKKNASL